MWPELDVLVPLDLLATVGPLEIEFGVVKFDIRTDEVFRYVNDRAVGCEIAVKGVLLGREGQAAQARVVGAVAAFQIEDTVGFGARGGSVR